MKKIVVSNARDPKGYYNIKYIAYNNRGKTDLAVSERTIYVEKHRITAFNTLQGRKYWEVDYLGTVHMSSSRLNMRNYIFHDKRC